MKDEGYIKYAQNWQEKPLPRTAPWSELEQIRTTLFSQNLIGAYQNGIGYGNLSRRYEPGFIISGSSTGHLSQLNEAHYAWVTHVAIEHNQVNSEGLIAASSESMTHDMFYRLDKTIQAVIHVHHQPLWEASIYKVPTTSESIPYGTPEMAGEIARLWKKSPLSELGFMAMAGHAEGIFTFGTTLTIAYERLLKALKSCSG